MSPVLMFCTPVFIFYGTEGVESIFHFLRFQTRFRLYRRRWIQFFMFSSPGPTLVGTEGVESYFLVLRSQTVLGCTEGAVSRLHVLLSRTHFGQYWGRRVSFSCYGLLFSCFALPDSYSTIPTMSSPVFFLLPDSFSAVPRAPTCIFNVLRTRFYFRRYRGRRVPFSCFALPDTFSTVPRASGPVLIFCAFRLVFDDT
jgi:hypothetical protein